MLLISTKWNTLHRRHLSQLFAVISHSAHLKEARSQPSLCFPFSSLTEWQLKCWSLHSFSYWWMPLCSTLSSLFKSIPYNVFGFGFLQHSVNQACCCPQLCGSMIIWKLTSYAAQQKCVFMCFLVPAPATCGLVRVGIFLLSNARLKQHLLSS